MGAHLADLGSLHSLLWLMEERERLMRITGHLTGSRLHPMWILPGGVAHDPDHALLRATGLTMSTMGARMVEYVTVLSGTSSVQARLQHAMSLRTEDVQPRWADRSVLHAVVGSVAASRVWEVYRDRPRAQPARSGRLPTCVTVAPPTGTGQHPSMRATCTGSRPTSGGQGQPHWAAQQQAGSTE